MHTWYQLQSLKAWRLVRILVYQRNLKHCLIVFLLLRRLWESRSGYIQDNLVSTWKDSVFVLIHNSTRGKIKGKIWDNSQLATVCHPNLWNDALRTKSVEKVFRYKNVALSAHTNLIFLQSDGQRFREIICSARFTSLHQQQTAERLHGDSLIHSSCCDDKDLMVALLCCSRTLILSFKLHSTQTQCYAVNAH